jgi:flagellar motility protein MotE (MotC chaperone)|tara:strand:+ start:1655 stop:1861 length:207 start_codon:yes stop_codon:yes gene_type:complete
MAKIPVEGMAGLYRDGNSGAIINSNKSNAQIAKERRKRVLQEQKRLETLENDMSEIKGMLKKLLKKKK